LSESEFTELLNLQNKSLNEEQIIKYKQMNPDKNIPFLSIDWANIPKTEHKGETGIAYWQTVQLPGLRIRLVEYTKDYVADHWCQKGHIVHCLEGEFVSELENGDETTFRKGMTYLVSDNLSSHRSRTKNGVKLMIIDGDFLKQE
jgi:hypothetical protein